MIYIDIYCMNVRMLEGWCMLGLLYEFFCFYEYSFDINGLGVLNINVIGY